MKKIFVLILALLLGIMAACPAFAEEKAKEKPKYQYLTGNETDIAGTGEYEGYRKIINHKMAGEYDLYFIIHSQSPNQSYQMTSQYIGNHDMNEIMRFTLDGKGYAGTRAFWYEALKTCEPNGKEQLHKIVGDKFFNEYFAYYYGHGQAERITNEYIERIIFKIEPVDRYALANVKVEQPKKKKWYEKIF